MELQISDGSIVLIDESDKEFVSQWKWRTIHQKQGGPYVSRRMNGKFVYMHREILGAVRGQIVDHINRNTIDNRRSNLRFATAQQNVCNRTIAPSSSGFRGVCWHSRDRKWQAAIKCNRKTIFLGLFSNPRDGAKAYDAMARELFGEFAVLNFPLEVVAR